MSCIFRATGEDFDVDAFLTNCPIAPFKVWRRGEPRGGPEAPPAAESGIAFVVSDAEFTDWTGQLREAQAWFEACQPLVLTLTQWPGVSRAWVDFGAALRPPNWRSYTLPPDLAALIGSLGVHIMLSVYPVQA